MQVQLEMAGKSSPFVSSIQTDCAQDACKITVVPKFALGWRYSIIGMITVTVDGKELKQLLAVDKRTGKLTVRDEVDETEDDEPPASAAGAKA